MRQADMHTLEGSDKAKGFRFAIVVARFNDFMTDRLLAGALEALSSRGDRVRRRDRAAGAGELRDSDRGAAGRRDRTIRRRHLPRAVSSAARRRTSTTSRKPSRTG